MPLTIGMVRDVFIEKMSERCKVTKVPVGDDSWVISERSDESHPIGMVEFTAGRISEVRRSWAPNDDRAADFARNIVSAVESGLQGRTSSTGTINYRISREPDLNPYQLILSLPDHREVRISLIENPASSASKRIIMLDIDEAIVK